MPLVHSPLNLEGEQPLNTLLKGGEECGAPTTVKMNVDNPAASKTRHLSIKAKPDVTFGEPNYPPPDPRTNGAMTARFLPSRPNSAPNHSSINRHSKGSTGSSPLSTAPLPRRRQGSPSPTKTPRALRRRRPIASPAKDGATPIRSASPSDDSSPDKSFSNWRSLSSYAPPLSTAPTSVSGFSRSSPKSSSPTKSSNRPAHTSISTSTSSRGSTKSSHGKQLDSTLADWAKGIKWLSASEDEPARPSRSWTHPRRSSVDLSTSASSASSIFNHPVVIDRSEQRRSFDSATSDRPNRWDLMGDSNNAPTHHKRSNSIGPGSGGGVVGTRRRRARTRTSAAADAEMQKRMSAVLEVDDNGEVIGTSVVPASQHDGSPKPPSLHGRSRSSPGRPLSVMSRSSGMSSYRTVELPSIPATTDGQVT
ncbi:hypothetical protein M407DRAFT_30666 [Tulasnella calospora MUT 4182]|uniref:Uncharacterized protein n=1 Tax=Tulasnella calospora MUT 4182 TaxID=1051891 RepID=A0A0C3Q7V4_9AGAM|nr:hypothetical protein M407DRAFT_30666 [Tulasnella calospora MUT 4182]